MDFTKYLSNKQHYYQYELRGCSPISQNNLDLYRILQHRIRRCILEFCYEKGEQSFEELLNHCVNGNHGKLGFHLRAMGRYIEHNSITHKYRLTDSGKKAGSLVLDARLLSVGNGPTANAAEYVKDLDIGTHAVMFSTNDDYGLDISCSFLISGLTNGYSAFYLAQDYKLNSITEEIRNRLNLEPSPLGALNILSAEEWYMQKGKFNAEKITNNWVRLSQKQQKAGYKGIYVCGETEVFFDYSKTEELLMYEGGLGKSLGSSMSAICIYDNPRFYENIFETLTKYHSHIIYKNKAIKTA